MARVLIVDDEASLRRILRVMLDADGHRVAEAATVAEAAAQLGAALFDLVITDYRLPDGDGLAVLGLSREADPAVPVVVLTAYATIELAVDAMRRGAFDVLTKPFVPDVVQALVRRAGGHAALLRENARLRDEVRLLAPSHEILGATPAIVLLRETIARVAASSATVLVTGETGTGKELVARALHDGSARAQGPFVALNCAAFPEGLLESELFGHERGAFTGADAARRGLFEAAHQGTLFLDEIGELPLAAQAKLLRVLSDGLVTRLGARTPIPVDVRIVSATHRDLAAAVQAGRFREDLYFRLAVVPLHVPALRERPDDLPLLAGHLVRQACRRMGVPPRPVSATALERLAGYSFPGNVRELSNLLERALILAEGPAIEAEDIALGGAAARHAAGDARAAWVDGLPLTIDLRGTLDAVEDALIRRALRGAGGVQAEAARRLGLSRSDMNYKTRRLGIDPAAP